ncbi:hypothetical protein GCM10017767_18000 [Halomonas urumqiensis]|nr:hypothetical protein GCM10017767_18000 [Halomonas urumqiensis]
MLTNLTTFGWRVFENVTNNVKRLSTWCYWTYSHRQSNALVQGTLIRNILFSESTMKRKPDLVMALVLFFGIGVVATGYAQALAGG